MKQNQPNQLTELKWGSILSVAALWLVVVLLAMSGWLREEGAWILLLLAVAAVVLTVCAWMLDRKLFKPMDELTDVVKNWSSTEPDELSKQIQMIPGPMGELEEVFCSQMCQVEHRMAGIEEKTREETAQTVRSEVASQIGQMILPLELKDYPSRQFFEVAGLVRPGKQERRVFYDFFFIDPALICVTAGEVPDHGVSATFFMAIVQFMIRNRLRMGRSLSETASDLNTQIFDYGARDEVRVFIGTLDVGMGVFSYVNAGLSTPMIMRDGERYERLETASLTPLGRTQDVTYRAENIRLRQGDRLFLYTEGLDQAKDPKGTGFGEQALRDALNRGRSKKEPEDSLRSLADEAAAFCASDDDHPGYAALMLEYRKGEKEETCCRVPGTPDHTDEVMAYLKSRLEENGIRRRHYARIAVLTDELFVLCCRSLEQDDEITAEFDVSPDAQSVTIRLGGPFRGQNPLEKDGSGPSGQAADFIQKHGDYVQFKPGEEFDTISVVCFI